MNIKNIFLDAGGVILNEDDFEKNMALIITGTVKKYLPEYSVENYRADAEEAVYRFVPRVYDYILYKYIKNMDEFYEARKACKNVENNGLKNDFTVSEGLEDFLSDKSRYFCIGILGQYGAALRDFLENEKLLKYFAFTETQENYRITKPDPRYFEAILKTCGCDPRESVMIGDRIDKDIIPAKAAGMKTIRLRTGLHANQEPRTPDEIADFTFGRLRDITVEIIGKIPI